MLCASCQARLLAQQTDCLVCGARQPGSAGAAHLHAHSPWAAWMAAADPRAEGWRIWTSFFLAGLYAPLAASWLAAREEWTAGLGRGGLPPAPPSQRGAIVLLLSIALPILLILVLGYVVSMFDVRPRPLGFSPVIVGLEALPTAQRFLWMNLLLSAIYPAFAIHARLVDRRFEQLLARLTHADPVMLQRYREGRPWRVAAALLGLLPLVVLMITARLLLDHGWSEVQYLLALLYIVALAVAAWATSWLALQPALRFRSLLHAGP
ncbi:MAG: hypothetical protein EA398_15655 [Deltaproteobacteria bacterium]|nr:MAG: hypothetical protein EA398_15655 [Deltaproteobacteria bacterium]